MNGEIHPGFTRVPWVNFTRRISRSVVADEAGKVSVGLAGGAIAAMFVFAVLCGLALGRTSPTLSEFGYDVITALPRLAVEVWEFFAQFIP